MHGLFERVLREIEKQRSDLALCAQMKRDEVVHMESKFGALNWIIFSLDAENKRIAFKTLGVQPADWESPKRILIVVYLIQS